MREGHLLKVGAHKGCLPPLVPPLTNLCVSGSENHCRKSESSFSLEALATGAVMAALPPVATFSILASATHVLAAS